MDLLLSLLLNPLASTIGLAAFIALLYNVTFVSKVVCLFIAGGAYLVFSPRPKRNFSLWSALAKNNTTKASRCRKIRSILDSDPAIRMRKVPLIVVSYEQNGSSFLTHAIKYADEAFDLTPLMFTVTPAQSFLSRLPVARFTLSALGGLMEYQRPLLLRILKRKSQAAVILQAPVVNNSVSLQHKGVFAAAIKSGALLVPVIMRAHDAEPAVGRPIGTQQAEVPLPEEIRATARTFASNLIAAYSEISGNTLTVSNL